MTKPIARDPMYRKRVFDTDIIELCVRWYITYRLSYRDLVEMMAERGIKVAHSTILRWVTRYVPAPSSKSDGLGSRRQSAPRGEWTRPTFRSRRSGTTCIEPWFQGQHSLSRD
jgi:transposase-like protein